MDSQMKSLLCVAGVWRVKKACENGGTRTAVRRNILWAKGSNSDRTSKNLKDWKHCFLFLRNFKPDVIIETDSLLIIKHQLKQVLVGYEVTIFKPKTYQNPSLRYPSLTSFPSRTELWGKVPRPVWVANQRPHLCLWKAKPTWPRRWQWFICDSKKKHRRRRGLDVLYEFIGFWVMLPNMFHSVAILSFFWAD